MSQAFFYIALLFIMERVHRMNILGTFSFALLSLEVKGEENKIPFSHPGMRSVKALLKQSGKLTYVDVDAFARFFFFPTVFRFSGRRCPVIQAASLTFFPPSLSLLLQTPRPQKCQILLLLQKFFPPPPLFFQCCRRCFVEFLPVLPASGSSKRFLNIYIFIVTITVKCKKGYCHDLFHTA